MYIKEKKYESIYRKLLKTIRILRFFFDPIIVIQRKILIFVKHLKIIRTMKITLISKIAITLAFLIIVNNTNSLTLNDLNLNLKTNLSLERVTESLDDISADFNRVVNKESSLGMEHVYIRKNIVGGKNVLTQDMISKPNTIYIIQYDYDLNDAKIVIPENSVLDFQGGSLNNGIIIGNGTKINATKYKIFSDIIRNGKFVVDYIYPQWFGALGNGVNDDTNSIQEAVDFASYFTSGFYGEITGISVKIPAGVYHISSTINIKSNAGINVIGDGHTKSILWNKSGTDIFSLSGNNFRGKFDGLRLTTNQGKLSGTAISIIGSGNQIYVTNCWINNLKYGIYCNPSSDSNIHNNTFEYVQTPIYIGGTGSGYFDIAFNVFYNVGPIAQGDDIFAPTFEFNKVTSLTFHHNRITNDAATSAQQSLIKINNCSNIQIENNIFNGNKFRAQSIKVLSSNNVTIKSNFFPKNYNGHQCFISESNDVYIVENIFPTKVTGDYKGLYINNSDYIFIDKNIIGKQSLQNIEVRSTNKINFISITNNQIEGGTIIENYPTIELHNIKNLIFTNNTIMSKDINKYDFILDTTTKAIISLNIFADTAYIDGGTIAILDNNFGKFVYNIITSKN